MFMHLQYNFYFFLLHVIYTLYNTSKPDEAPTPGVNVPGNEFLRVRTQTPRSWLRRSIMHVTLPFLVHATVCVVCSVISVHISEWVMTTSCPAGLAECTLIYGIEMCRCVCIHEQCIITGDCSSNIFSPESHFSKFFFSLSKPSLQRTKVLIAD